MGRGRAMGMKVQGRKGRRPKRRWWDSVSEDIREKGLSGGSVRPR